MIGQTQGKMFFVTEVKPGVHYVISHADNTDTVRLNFEAGKIYLLQQGIYPGWNATTRYSPMTTEEFAKEVQEAIYAVYDTQKPRKDMSDKDFKEAKDDFEKEAKQGEHKDTLQIKGYTRLK
jgi:lipoate-protein ligase A